MKHLPIICAFIWEIIMTMLPPYIYSGEAQPAKAVPPAIVNKGSVYQGTGKETEKAIKLNDTANRRIDNAMDIVTGQDDKKDAYISVLEQRVKNRDDRVDWLVKYAARLKAENSRITLLTVPRHRGDTLSIIFNSEDMEEFINHIADSVRATVKPDSAYFFITPHRRNILSRTYYDTTAAPNNEQTGKAKYIPKGEPIRP